MGVCVNGKADQAERPGERMGVGTVTKRGELATGSVAWNVVQFFRANPDEELLTDDIRAKWSESAARIPQLLAPSVSAGLLNRRQEPRDNGAGGVRFVYSAGPELR